MQTFQKKILIDKDDPLLKELQYFASYAQKAYCLYSEDDKLMDKISARAEINQNQIVIYSFSSIKVDSKIQKSFEKAQEKLYLNLSRLILEYPRHTFCLVGHGIAGSYAVLTGLFLKHEFGRTDINIYTYGQPRMGNQEMAHHINLGFTYRHHGIYRVTNGYEYAPQYPEIFDGYFHPGTEYWISPNNCDCETKSKIYQCTGGFNESGYFDENQGCNNGYNQEFTSTSSYLSHYGPYFGYWMFCSNEEPVPLVFVD
ncbi:hypothetical protein G9A89_012604 [Geosiphon pyriformis]|nr:hypothetical protein G9A89_012604 [Geosiphon pyriformis]